MRVRYAALLVASLSAAAAVVTVDAWRRHGRHELARLAKEAKADLRDALKADKEVVRHYVYDTWPYWWGSPRYGLWEERSTFIYAPQPAPQPAPRRGGEVGGAPPTVDVKSPRVVPPPRPAVASGYRSSLNQ